MENFKLLIGGELRSGSLSAEVLNPATETSVAACPRASANDVQDAVDAAKAAFPSWSKTSVEERQATLGRLADLIESHAERLAASLVAEQGKPVSEAQQEVAGASAFLRFYSTLVPGDVTLRDDSESLIRVRRRPLGVVAGIVPWNFPLLLAIWKLGPATLAGNAFILKPAATTPLTTLLLGELCAEIFPPGVVNIIADRDDIGSILSGHPDIAKVSFTGSAETGRRIMTSGADTLKRLTLELGGNDPALILGDVDVEETAAALFRVSFANCGQVCIAVKRAYVHQDIYDAFAEAISSIAASVRVGEGANPDTDIGPIQNKRQYDRVLSLLSSARQEGSIAAGGAALDGSGYFVQPTVVRDVDNGARIVDEEQFGPILPLIKIPSAEEGIKRCNASEYGLGASVWTKDYDRGLDLAGQIESGTVWLNKHADIGPHIPMAGCKQSGLGVEQAQEGLNEYAQLQVINTAR